MIIALAAALVLIAFGWLLPIVSILVGIGLLLFVFGTLLGMMMWKIWRSIIRG